MHRRKFSTPNLDLSHTRCQDGLVVHRSTWPENLVVIRSCTHHLGFWLLLHAPTNITCSYHAPKHCCWCHLTLSLHVSSHASTSTSARATSALDTSSNISASHVSSVASSAPRHLADRWPRPTRPGPPGSDPWALSVDFDHGPVDFDFLRWPLTKSQIFRQCLSCSVFRIDSNFELYFFVWSSKIGQLAHSSLWFLQRLYSWHLQEIFSCLSNLKPSSSFRLEFEGRC